MPTTIWICPYKLLRVIPCIPLLIVLRHFPLNYVLYYLLCNVIGRRWLLFYIPLVSKYSELHFSRVNYRFNGSCSAFFRTFSRCPIYFQISYSIFIKYFILHPVASFLFPYVRYHVWEHIEHLIKSLYTVLSNVMYFDYVHPLRL